MSGDDEKPPPAPLRHLAEWLPGVRTALAFVAVLAYVLLRIAYGRFYAPFGLTPDDLGLGYLELLTQSALGAAALLGAIGLSVALCFAAIVGVAVVVAGISPWRRETTSKRVVRVSALVLVSAVAVLVVTGVCPAPTAVVGVLFAFASVTVLRASQQLNAKVQDPAGVTWPFLLREVLPVPAILATIIGGAMLISDGDAAGRAARAGQPTNNTLFGVRLIPWRAEAATIQWTATDVDVALRPLAGSCVMYLGQSDGMVFVYSPGPARRGTYRIPAAAVVVHVVPDADCVRGSRSPSGA